MRLRWARMPGTRGWPREELERTFRTASPDSPPSMRLRLPDATRKSEGLSCAYLFNAQPRVIGKNRTRGKARIELAQDHVYRNTRATNDRLSAHDRRVDINPIVR